ncbi:hypothetical protein OSTOST_25265, partial [Ostertagia ostertagi]
MLQGLLKPGSEYELLSITTQCILLSIFFAAWSVAKMDFATLTVYCSATTSETTERITILLFTLCGADAVSLAGIAFLQAFNVAAIKMDFSDLRSSYQLRENTSVLGVILPLIIFDGFCHLAYSTTRGVLLLFRGFFSNVTYRTVLTASY